MIPGNSQFSVPVSSAIREALEERCRVSGESLAHVVQSLLADGLGIEHHTLFQVSTSTALVEGIYKGCVRVAEIRTHGDFGLGTFDSLDGEGMMLDGCVWQAKGDGSVVEAPGALTAPFWVSTKFSPDRRAELAAVTGWEDLCRQLDALRISENLFVAFRVDGVFDQIHYRVACKAQSGESLVNATGHQAEFHVTECPGTLLGFWSPGYAKTLNVPGYHLHLLSTDHRVGGHVLGLAAKNLSVHAMDADNLTVAFPHTKQFLQADLSIDPALELKTAEGAQGAHE